MRFNKSVKSGGTKNCQKNVRKIYTTSFLAIAIGVIWCQMPEESCIRGKIKIGSITVSVKVS